MNIILSMTMVLCVVFAPLLKSTLDLSNLSKKVTTQQLLEEEISDKTSKIEKEAYTKSNSFLTIYTKTAQLTYSISNFSSHLKITKPCLKVHTPPPDYL